MHPIVRQAHDAERCVSMYGLPGCDQPADRFRENANREDTQLLLSGPDRTRVMSAAMDEIKYAKTGMADTLGIKTRAKAQHALMTDARRLCTMLQEKVGKTWKQACTSSDSIFTPVYEMHARAGADTTVVADEDTGVPLEQAALVQADDDLLAATLDGDNEGQLEMDEGEQGDVATVTSGSKNEKKIARNLGSVPAAAMMGVFQSPSSGGGSPWERYSHRLMHKMLPLMRSVCACHGLPPPVITPLPPAVRPTGRANAGRARRRQQRQQQEEAEAATTATAEDEMVEEWLDDGTSEDEEPVEDDPCELCGRVQTESAVPQLLCSNEECGACYCPPCVGYDEAPDGDWWCPDCTTDVIDSEPAHRSSAEGSSEEDSEEEYSVTLAHRIPANLRNCDSLQFMERIGQDHFNSVCVPGDSGMRAGMRKFNVGDCCQVAYQVTGRSTLLMGYIFLVRLFRVDGCGRFQGFWLWPKFDNDCPGNSIMPKHTVGFMQKDLLVSPDRADGQIESLECVVQVLDDMVWKSATPNGKAHPNGPWRCKAAVDISPPNAQWHLFPDGRSWTDVKANLVQQHGFHL